MRLVKMTREPRVPSTFRERCGTRRAREGPTTRRPWRTWSRPLTSCTSTRCVSLPGPGPPRAGGWTLGVQPAPGDLQRPCSAAPKPVCEAPRCLAARMGPHGLLCCGPWCLRGPAVRGRALRLSVSEDQRSRKGEGQWSNEGAPPAAAPTQLGRCCEVVHQRVNTTRLARGAPGLPPHRRSRCGRTTLIVPSSCASSCLPLCSGAPRHVRAGPTCSHAQRLLPPALARPRGRRGARRRLSLVARAAGGGPIPRRESLDG